MNVLIRAICRCPGVALNQKYGIDPTVINGSIGIPMELNATRD